MSNIIKFNDIELADLMLEYAETLDDGDKDEIYTTYRKNAQDVLADFLKFAVGKLALRDAIELVNRNGYTVTK